MDPRLKAQIRLELFCCAAEGNFPSYQEFYERVNSQKNEWAISISSAL